jgi:hypothetical protein
MAHPKGHSRPLSPSRRFICDLLHFARRVPTVPMQRRMQLAPVVAARKAAHPRPGWCAIFAKAYALVCAARPELRRAYLSFPRPRLYEHPICVASIGIERRLGDEDAVFFTQLRQPEQRGLLEIEAHLRRCREEPVGSLSRFLRILKISRLPRPLRRLLWWVGLNTSGRQRAHLFGTFGLSVTAGLGAAALHQLSPLTTALNYGVIAEDGSVDVRLVYDHRVTDGAPVARALADLERILNAEIVDELRHFRGPEALVA